MQNIKTKDVLVYATMPRVLPRVRDLFGSGFSYISFWMAHVYYLVRLLPRNHPYLLSENIGRFGIRHVLFEASRNLKFSWKNIDQIIVYIGILTGLVMLIAQLFIFAYTLIGPFIFPAAMAFSWFDTPDPANDIVFNLLDRVFGVPGVFCSSATPANCTNYSMNAAFGTPGPATGATIMPLPFHLALHDLFEFYSTALLSIAVLIVLYFIVVIIFETTTSGTPFGQRFQNVWVPVRLVIAVGLLLPVTYGLNSGQFIVLYTAKFGSSFASTGWNEFNAGIQSHSMWTSAGSRPVGEQSTLLAIPEVPDITPLVEAMSLVHACAYSYVRLHAGGFNETSAPLIDFYPAGNVSHQEAFNQTDFRVVPFLIKQRTGSMVNGAIAGSPIIGSDLEHLWIPDQTTVDYMDALGFYYGSDIIIRFGERAEDVSGTALDNESLGNVTPLCGDIRIPVVDLRDPGGAGANRGGADHMLRGYYDMVLQMWFDDEEMRQFARSYVTLSQEDDEDKLNAFCNGNETSGPSLSGQGTPYPGFQPNAADCARYKPTASWKQEKIREYMADLRVLVLDAWSNHVNNSIYEDLDATIVGYGWGGAGIWYSKISEINGGWMDGVTLIPYMDNYPLVMEEVREQNNQSNETVPLAKQFTPSTKAQSGADKPEGFKELTQPMEVALPLSTVYEYWNHDEKDMDSKKRKVEPNIFKTAMNMLFGTSGLAAIRTSNAHLHPLVQLTMVGKGLVDSAVRNIAGATGAAFLGGMFGAMEGFQEFGSAAQAASQVLQSTAFMGLTAGFVLFYILPFLPFVYFYFAIASWVKAIFEAMVGVPLWALAHLRIDGDGLPGDAAQNGYFLILEIFIRPILTVVGLVAAVIIFSTQVRILNLIWDLVSANVAGSSVAQAPASTDILGMTSPSGPLSLGSVNDAVFQRGIIDQFFFTVIYTIVCYMMALASFKLIDRIPDNILRWAGAGVSSFGDINQDQIESLNRYAAMGGMTVGNQAAGAVVQLGGGAGKVVGGELNAAMKGSPAPAGQAKPAEPTAPPVKK